MCFFFCTVHLVVVQFRWYFSAYSSIFHFFFHLYKLFITFNYIVIHAFRNAEVKLTARTKEGEEKKTKQNEMKWSCAPRFSYNEFIMQSKTEPNRRLNTWTSNMSWIRNVERKRKREKKKIFVCVTSALALNEVEVYHHRLSK